MSYTNQHKILLQTIMGKGLLTDDEVKELVLRLFDTDDVSKMMYEINQQLQPLDFLIKRAQCEFTGKPYWVFTDTVLDEITRVQTEFSKGQLALLRLIFSEIMVSESKCLQSIYCLNLCTSSEVKISKSDGEEFLDDIVKRQWLILKDGCYYMGVRSITELMPYFRATYGQNLTNCSHCKGVIFHGKRCDNCDAIVHLYCLKRFIYVHNSMQCLKCGAVMSNVDLSGIEEEYELEDQENTSNVEVSKTRKAVKRKCKSQRY